MQFSSLFFILLFLPVFFLFYSISGTVAGKNKVLLIFSLLFYCLCGVKYAALMVVMAFVGWFFGIKIKNGRSQGEKIAWLVASITFFLVVLGFFKYTGFFLDVFGSLVGEDTVLFSIALPVGISFYTFKLISYTSDVYKERIKPEESFLLFLTYLSMFQHASQGPIVRYSDIVGELTHRTHRADDMANGIFRCCAGLAKKAVLADHCAALAEDLLPLAGSIAELPVSAIWLGSLCYMLQIYLDFSAYSDIAIGLAQICGFHFKENFNYPYIASSVKDFWRRWHISLSTFFRDYVYIPLGGSRVSAARTALNLFVVWLLTGFWHGAGWNYIIWGLFFFAFIIIENKIGSKGLPKPLMHALTLFIVFVSWIIFRFEDFGQMASAVAGLFGFGGSHAASGAVRITFFNNIFFLTVAALVCTPIFKKLAVIIRDRLCRTSRGTEVFYLLRIIVAAVLLLIGLAAVSAGTYTPFLYNQF